MLECSSEMESPAIRHMRQVQMQVIIFLTLKIDACKLRERAQRYLDGNTTSSDILPTCLAKG